MLKYVFNCLNIVIHNKVHLITKENNYLCLNTKNNVKHTDTYERVSLCILNETYLFINQIFIVEDKKFGQPLVQVLDFIKSLSELVGCSCQRYQVNWLPSSLFAATSKVSLKVFVVCHSQQKPSVIFVVKMQRTNTD